MRNTHEEGAFCFLPLLSPHVEELYVVRVARMMLLSRSSYTASIISHREVKSLKGRDSMTLFRLS
jgi:hypothetical protein